VVQFFELIGVDLMGVVDEIYVEPMKQSAMADKRFDAPNGLAQIEPFIAEHRRRWTNGHTFSTTGCGWMP